MKLSYRIITRISLLLTAVLVLWAVFFYFAIVDEVNDETDDALEDYSETIIIRALAGEELPIENNGSNNQYYLTEVSEEYADKHEFIQYKDSMIFITEKNETEPARILSTIFKDEEGKWYELTVSTPTIEKNDLKLAILYWVIFLYAVLLITIISISAWILYRNMKPLYRLLNWLDNYKIGKYNAPLSNDTKISEFKKLYEAITKNAQRNEQMFDQQKQFIGNASHEIQTPLAICRNRLEMLMEDESLMESQLKEVSKTLQTLEYITKLNKSLLLLSKIDNNQFPETKEIEINPLLKQYLNDFREAYEYRKIQIEVKESGVFEINMNESLATICIVNILKNSFVHNIDNGQIHIAISPTTLTICNSGMDIPLDEKHLFERFYQGNKKEGSTGLGLAIVNSTCKLQGLQLKYYFKNKEHCFELSRK